MKPYYVTQSFMRSVYHNLQTIRFRTTGKVFNLTRFNAKLKTFQTHVREVLNADDADFVGHTEGYMQAMMDLFSKVCTAFGLTIILNKTKVMFTPPPVHPYAEPNIFVEGTRLDVVDSFVYLGSTLSRDGSLVSEIHLRIEKASKACRKLENRVWSDGVITIKTMFSVYESYVLTALLYSSETCLRSILNIKWQSLTPDTVVLQQASTSGIEMLIIRNQMRWAGHLTRMEDDRLPKQLFYGELRGKRPRHKPKDRFKDVVKNNLKAVSIDVEDWEKMTENRSVWRKVIYDGCKGFEARRVDHSIVKRALRKQDASNIPDSFQTEHVCDICSRACLSKAGLVSHMRSHGGKQSQADYAEILPRQPIVFACLFCDKYVGLMPG